MLKIEALRDELVLVANVVGEHKKVAEATNNSLSFLAQIRNGSNVKINTKKNTELIQNLIDAYRREGRKKTNALREVLQTSDYISKNRKFLWEFVNRTGFDSNHELCEKGIEEFLKYKIEDLQKTDESSTIVYHLENQS